MKTLLIMLAVIFPASLHAQDDDLKRLKANYEISKQRALAPIDAAYRRELEKLLDRHTKSGKLDAAIAVKSEIATLSPQRSVTASVTPIAEKLSKKERDAIDAAFQGKWTWKDGGINVANQTIYRANDRWAYEIKTDGTIQVFSKPGSKLALLTLKPDKTTYTATDATGASWEGKHQ